MEFHLGEEAFIITHLALGLLAQQHGLSSHCHLWHMDSPVAGPSLASAGQQQPCAELPTSSSDHSFRTHFSQVIQFVSESLQNSRALSQFSCESKLKTLEWSSFCGLPLLQSHISHKDCVYLLKIVAVFASMESSFLLQNENMKWKALGCRKKRHG